MTLIELGAIVAKLTAAGYPARTDLAGSRTHQWTPKLFRGDRPSRNRVFAVKGAPIADRTRWEVRLCG